MRRAIAFTIDTFLCSLVVTAVLELISKLSNRDLVNAYSILLGVALIFSVFEHFYGGYTPGKFVCRIRLVTADGKVPSLFRLFVRSSMLFLASSIVALLATLLVDWMLRRPLGFEVHHL